MQGSRGMVASFVAGLVVAGGALLLLRDDDITRIDATASYAELGARLERLERSVAQLSAALVRGTEDSASGAATVTPAAESPPANVAAAAEQRRAIASAESFVDQAIQSGRWTQHQQGDLSELVAGLPLEEQGRIQARISAAINNDQIKPDIR